jgi:hypothetical protein
MITMGSPGAGMTVSDTLDQQVAIRLSKDDLGRLDAMKDRLPIASRNAIARAALRLGLDLLEEDPTRLLKPPAKAEKRRPTDE